MSLPTIDLTTIVIGAVIECIINTIIFALFKVRNLTLIITAFILFIIPTFQLMYFSQINNFDINKTMPALADWIIAYVINFVGWSFSAVFGSIINKIIGIPE
jgi:hypothetical protein